MSSVLIFMLSWGISHVESVCCKLLQPKKQVDHLDNAIYQMGQVFATLRTRDLRLNEVGRIDFCLNNIINGWKHQDSPTK
jgi:hypothetical protein